MSQTDTEHLLMGNRKTCTVRQFLHGFNRQVRADSPVGTQQNGHHNHHGHGNVGTGSGKLRKRKDQQPESGSGLLHLYVSGSEQCTAFGNPVEAHKQNVDNKRNQQ